MEISINVRNSSEWAYFGSSISLVRDETLQKTTTMELISALTTTDNK